MEMLIKLLWRGLYKANLVFYIYSLKCYLGGDFFSSVFNTASHKVSSIKLDRLLNLETSKFKRWTTRSPLQDRLLSLLPSCGIKTAEENFSVQLCSCFSVCPKNTGNEVCFHSVRSRWVDVSFREELPACSSFFWKDFLLQVEMLCVTCRNRMPKYLH